MEYYSAIKRNKIVSFSDTWMDLETVMQSEVSQKEKNKYCILHPIFNPPLCLCHNSGENLIILQGKGQYNGRLFYCFSVSQSKKLLYFDEMMYKLENHS